MRSGNAPYIIGKFIYVVCISSTSYKGFFNVGAVLCGRPKKGTHTGVPLQSRVSEEVFPHPPALGEHTEEILQGLLGYDSQWIRQLIQQKITFQEAQGSGTPEKSKSKEG